MSFLTVLSNDFFISINFYLLLSMTFILFQNNKFRLRPYLERYESRVIFNNPVATEIARFITIFK